MSDFRFATPDWSAALWGVVAAVALLLWLEWRRGDALSRFLSPIMQSRLVSRPSITRRVMGIILLGAAAICFVVALMRPQFGLTYIKSRRVGAQIMFCLDVSKSMLAEDTAPNRLERAKADITDLLTFLDGDQVGLIGFAGRASVLCPLTPDYGFFKLILDNADPGSVGRGGTRLEEPLRKAIEGFRSEGDVSRIVFLITDGEDHDSHPLDVASDAIQRGIKVVAIGLGDEAGSEVRITDPRTGVQTQLMDPDGKPVITRLDGETLRELALATEGVYIPAGTGSLDLKSIYDVHIKPLVRGEMQTEGRAVRQDAFQWAILAGLILMMASVVLGSGRAASSAGDPHPPSSSGVTRAALLLVFLSVAPAPALTAAKAAESAAVAPVAENEADEGADARQIYNQGLKQLPSDPDEAEKLFTSARRQAATDGEVRFRATYNMGWVEVTRADALIDKQPGKALEHLQLAAGWFRDSIRLRKDAADARHNLEVILLRILQLRDRISKENDQDLATQLDALISTQRKTIADLRTLVEQVTASDDPNIADEFRSQFRRLAVDQRVAISDLQDVVEKAASELDTLEDESEADRSAETRIRMAQLGGVLNYLNQASQRLGQSRSQLRRRQASRGFRRAASGLSQLKRARDQLHAPLQILDGILADATMTAQETALKSLDNSSVTTDAQTAGSIPSWIDQDYLAESQIDLAQRTEELTTRLAAGLESRPVENADDPNPSSPTEEQQEFLERLQAAMPHLLQASEAMGRASEKIDLPEYAAASLQQIEAIKALQEAREQFADLRGLIELAFATQSSIADALAQLAQTLGPQDDGTSEEADADDESLWGPVVQFVTPNQTKNLQRMERLEGEISKQLARTRSTTSENAAPQSAAPQTAGQPSPEVERLALASKLAQRAARHMNGVAGNLLAEKATAGPQQGQETQSPETDDRQRSIDAVKTEADAAVESLKDLRRLFFSIVEHLQEAAQRQAQLNDETEQLAGTQAESEDDIASTPEQAGRLASRQDQLARTAAEIAKALEQQATQPAMPSEQADALDPGQQEVLEQNSRKAKQAAELVLEAEQQMTRASEHLGGSEPGIADARPPQDVALEKLVEALQQLQPPQQEPSEQQQQPSGDQQQQQESGESDPEQQQQSQQSEQMDLSRVLQAVRDREAQRRRDRDQRKHTNQVPVEKDW